MNKAAHTVQHVVLAGNGDKQTGERSCERAVLAEVAALEAELRRHPSLESEHRREGRLVSAIIHRIEAAAIVEEISELRRAATGENVRVSDSPGQD